MLGGCNAKVNIKAHFTRMVQVKSGLSLTLIYLVIISCFSQHQVKIMADSATKATEPNNNLPDEPKKVNGVANHEDPSLSEAFKNLSVEDLIRGQTPKDIEQRCLELCGSYIGGSWLNAKTTDDVLVKRISGGLTNQLYHVHLKDSVARVENAIYPDEPSDVAIKLYMEKHMKNYVAGESERLSDIIVLTIVSQTGIGPKVYGIFNDGVILAYHKVEN